MKCENCEKTADAMPFELAEFNDAGEPITTSDLCSLACLCEFAWKLREQQPKLSKSKIGVE